MKAFTSLASSYLLLLLTLVGCAVGLQPRSTPPDAATATSGMVISLSTPKEVYTRKDNIALDLSIKNGQFDLLLSFTALATPAVFKQLSVRDSEGNLIEPERQMNAPVSEDIFIPKNGKSIQCIQGFELKAESTHKVLLENLQKYYKLQEGRYTITTTIILPIYRDFLKKQHPEITELEEEIKRIQKVTDAHVSAADKRSAVNDLQQQIDLLEKRRTDIYLPVQSLLGKASMRSNSITFAIE